MNVSSIILEKLYNRKFKELFLEEYLYEDSSKESYAVILVRVGKYEQKLDLDLCNFNKQQIIGMFSDMKITSPPSMKTLFNVCKVYSSWTGGKKFNKEYNIPFANIDYEEDVFPLLDFSELKNKYLSEKQLWDIIDNYSLNAQDSICLLLPFYFIKNDKCIDMVNLKIKDINIDKSTITVENRNIVLPKKVIEIAIMSYYQTTYNRTGEKGYGDRDTCAINSSKHIIRPSNVNNNNDGIITAQSIASRCRKVLELAGIKNTSINDVNMSGKLHLLKIIKDRYKRVTVSDYQNVNKLFGHSTTNYANVKRLFEIIYGNKGCEIDRPTFDYEVEKAKKLTEKEIIPKVNITKAKVVKVKKEKSNVEFKTSSSPNIIKYLQLKQKLISRKNMLKLGIGERKDVLDIEDMIKDLKDNSTKKELREMENINVNIKKFIPIA